MTFTQTKTDRFYERLMQEVPNFKRRQSGVIVSETIILPITFADTEIFAEIGSDRFTRRVNSILKGQKMKPRFISPEHKSSFLKLMALTGTNFNDSRMSAALFLLTSEKFLRKRTYSLVAEDKFNINNISLSGINVQQYALFKAAKEILTGRREISVCELSDKELIEDSTLMLILSAFLLCRGSVKAIMER